LSAGEGFADVDGFGEVCSADGFADAWVALGEAVGGSVAEGTSVLAPAAGVAATGPASDLWPGRSTRARETTIRATAADMNSQRLCTGPPGRPSAVSVSDE